jgi:hypothetical protein
MHYTLTFATLPKGHMLTQYGVRAPITLDSDGLGYPQNYGRDSWQDAHIPRTSSPVRFVPRVVAPFGLRWGMVNKWAIVSPSHVS